MTDPLVSIIVPTLNQAQYIGAALDSILQQDYARIECIVMDGGSTDGTVELLQRYTDPGFVWVSEPDRGQSDAINKGLRRARGDVLSYLNSDDLLCAGAVQHVVEYLSNHSDADLVYGDCNFIDPAGTTIRLMQGKPFSLEHALQGDYAITQPGTFWRRSVYERLGDFDTSLHYVMDIDYWMRAAIAGFRLVYVPQPLSAFRLQAESKSISAQPKFLTDWRNMVDKLYAQPDLPVGLRALKPESEQFIEWAWAKTYWMQRDYASARPLLKKYLRAGKRTRQIVAATMLVDSYAHTPFTRLLASAYRRATGMEILFEGGRVL